MATKSQRNPPPRRRRKKAKKTLKNQSTAKRSRKIDPVPKPPAELPESLRGKAKKPVKDPLPGGDPFDL
jgi:hypothetical protein